MHTVSGPLTNRSASSHHLSPTANRPHHPVVHLPSHLSPDWSHAHILLSLVHLQAILPHLRSESRNPRQLHTDSHLVVSPTTLDTGHLHPRLLIRTEALPIEPPSCQQTCNNRSVNSLPQLSALLHQLSDSRLGRGDGASKLPQRRPACEEVW